MRINKKCSKVSVLLLVFLVLFSAVAFAELEKEEGYFTVVDEDGKVIFQTAMEVHKGDWYINQNNKKYTVIEVNGDQAVVKYEGTVDLTPGEDKLSSSLLESGILLAEDAKREVGMYNTHSDESYQPSSGTHSEPGSGDVYEVSDRFATELRKRGTKVIASNAKHDPHDGGAYERSRRTAKKLVENRPDALFDIHRDGVPDPAEYLTTINGKQVGQVRLVVGRQNPGMKANDSFAKQLKSVTDKLYPGLIKGIFYAKGKYNQDLGPRAMLIEFGTYVVTKGQAIEATVLFADSVNRLLYGQEKQQAEGAAEADKEVGFGAFKSLLIIVGVVIVGIVGYLFINEGSLEGVINRIKHFFGEEFVSFFGFEEDNSEELRESDEEDNK
jgi:stage II sporulation protein P